MRQPLALHQARRQSNMQRLGQKRLLLVLFSVLFARSRVIHQKIRKKRHETLGFGGFRCLTRVRFRREKFIELTPRLSKFSKTPDDWTVVSSLDKTDTKPRMMRRQGMEGGHLDELHSVSVHGLESFRHDKSTVFDLPYRFVSAIVSEVAGRVGHTSI